MNRITIKSQMIANNLHLGKKTIIMAFCYAKLL